MAGGIAHDFNNILGAIIGFSEFVRDDLAEDNPSRADMDQVLQAVDRAKSLVQQILSFSRKGDHQLQIVEPYYIVQEVAKMLHSTLPSTVTIEEEIEKDSGKINADPTQIHQIVMNLCTNAFQAMENEKGTLGLSLQHRKITEEANANRAILPGNYVVLEVGDTGQGMDETTQERIFEPFFTTHFIGRGLGMAAVFGIVTNHDGSITVDSELEKGTTVRIYLPAVGTGDKAPGTALIREPEVKPVMGQGSILIIEDEASVMEMTRTILERLGYRVFEAATGEKAVEMAEKLE